MSCSEATAPIDISRESVVGKCDLKCEFSFHYNAIQEAKTQWNQYILSKW